MDGKSGGFMHHRSCITDECLDLAPPGHPGGLIRRRRAGLSGGQDVAGLLAAAFVAAACRWVAVVPRPDGDWPAMTAHILISSSGCWLHAAKEIDRGC